MSRQWSTLHRLPSLPPSFPPRSTSGTHPPCCCRRTYACRTHLTHAHAHTHENVGFSLPPRNSAVLPLYPMQPPTCFFLASPYSKHCNTAGRPEKRVIGVSSTSGPHHDATHRRRNGAAGAQQRAHEWPGRFALQIKPHQTPSRLPSLKCRRMYANRPPHTAPLHLTPPPARSCNASPTGLVQRLVVQHRVQKRPAGQRQIPSVHGMGPPLHAGIPPRQPAPWRATLTQSARGTPHSARSCYVSFTVHMGSREFVRVGGEFEVPFFT